MVCFLAGVRNQGSLCPTRTRGRVRCQHWHVAHQRNALAHIDGGDNERIQYFVERGRRQSAEPFSVPKAIVRRGTRGTIDRTCRHATCTQERHAQHRHGVHSDVLNVNERATKTRSSGLGAGYAWWINGHWWHCKCGMHLFSQNIELRARHVAAGHCRSLMLRRSVASPTPPARCTIPRGD